jgi:hypothetical protein
VFIRPVVIGGLHSGIPNRWAFGKEMRNRFLLNGFVPAPFSFGPTPMSKIVIGQRMAFQNGDKSWLCLVLVSFFIWSWEGEVSNRRYRKSKTILDWIKESVFLDFSGLANRINRLSSIEHSNETFWGLFCHWRELLGGGTRHCGLWLWIFQLRLIDFFREKWSIDPRLRASSVCFNIWQCPGWIPKETQITL